MFLFLVLHNDDLNSSGNNSSSNKLGLHIKSEQDASDPLGGVDNTFGQMNSQQPGSNRPSMMTSPERIQPLPSNVVNKSNSMDVSFAKFNTLFLFKKF